MLIKLASICGQPSNVKTEWQRLRGTIELTASLYRSFVNGLSIKIHATIDGSEIGNPQAARSMFHKGGQEMENSEQSYNHKHHVLERRGKSDLVSLNFKVPFNVRQQFKIHAALSGVSMTEFLLQLLKEKIR